eukprot:Skav207119  [mRNA]  locus=scaffold156:255848:256556:- [translate_table: standard]
MVPAGHRVSHDEVVEALNGLAGWSSGGPLEVSNCDATEWHQIFIAKNRESKVVASIPSWEGLGLESKILASEADSEGKGLGQVRWPWVKQLTINNGG